MHTEPSVLVLDVVLARMKSVSESNRRWPIRRGRVLTGNGGLDVFSVSGPNLCLLMTTGDGPGGPLSHVGFTGVSLALGIRA